MTEINAAEQPSLLPTIYAGWQTYQKLLITTLHPLTSDQLALRAAPHLRSIGEIVTHIIGAQARWFYQLMGEGGDAFAMLGTWDRPEIPERSAAELIEALETTWAGMQAAIGRWTPTEWQQTYPGDPPDEHHPAVGDLASDRTRSASRR